MRDSVLIYRSTYNALKALPPDMMKEAFITICEYAMDDVEPYEEGIGKALLEQCRLVIDRNNKNFENGKRGGKPPANRFVTDSEPNRNHSVTGTEPLPNRTVTDPEPTPNRSVTDPEPVRNRSVTQKEKGESIKEKGESIKDKNIKEKERVGRFTPPTATQIEEYCAENGLSRVDPQRFIDFYESKGWMVGKNHMKDWKAAVRNWNRSQRQESTAKSKNRFNNFPQREYDFTNLEKQLLGG